MGGLPFSEHPDAPADTRRIDRLRAMGLLRDDESVVSTGHFAYSHEHHGDTWLDLDVLLSNPSAVTRAAERLADQLSGCRPDVVCGPAVGGAVFGFAVADALAARFVWTEPATAPGVGRVEYELPPGARSAVSGARVAIVDNAIDAGEAMMESARRVEQAAGSPVAVGTLVLRAPGVSTERRGIECHALISATRPTWRTDDCALCRAGIDLGEPEK